MGFATDTIENNRSGFAGVIHGRRTTTLLALLLITVSLMTYSISNTIEFTTLPYHGGPNINTSKDTIAESQRPQDSSSLDGPPIPEHIGTETPSAAPEQSLLAEPSANSSIAQSVSNSTPSLTPLGGGVPFRVMILGDYSTRGRVLQPLLRDRLSTLGNSFDNVEALGHATAFMHGQIDYTREHATHVAPSGAKPNVFILYYLGADACIQDNETASKEGPMRDLVIHLLEDTPGVTVILPTRLANPTPAVESCVLGLNVQIRRLASALQREGRSVVLAEMHYEQGLPGRPLPADIAADGASPSDHGYVLMADILLSAFVEADRRGLLNTPEDNTVLEDWNPEGTDNAVIPESDTSGRPARRRRTERIEKITGTKDARPALLSCCGGGRLWTGPRGSHQTPPLHDALYDDYCFYRDKPRRYSVDELESLDPPVRITTIVETPALDPPDDVRGLYRKIRLDVRRASLPSRPPGRRTQDGLVLTRSVYTGDSEWHDAITSIRHAAALSEGLPRTDER
ncbi:hypothetical protein F5Y10DRAFT_271826 [Nemania abortiva]|nr:hypothetical protein F5Y10DRAFT_271826 [Nemania abortiva]